MKDKGLGSDKGYVTWQKEVYYFFFINTKDMSDSIVDLYER